MDWCPLWGLNTKRPVSVLIMQLSPYYTVYKYLMFSVCKFEVTLLCSLVRFNDEVQKSNHTVDTVHKITFILHITFYFMFLTLGITNAIAIGR